MDDKLIARIRKLLALAGNNPSQHQAEAALLKAQELMARQGLKMADIHSVADTGADKQVVTEYVNDWGRAQWWERRLLSIVARNFRCVPITCSGGGVTRLSFLGLKEDVTIAVEVFAYASKQMRRMAQEYTVHRGISGSTLVRQVKNDWYGGFLVGLTDMLAAQVEKNNWALVLVHDPAVEAAKREMQLCRFRTRAQRAGDDGAWRDGHAKGYSFSTTPVKEISAGEKV